MIIRKLWNKFFAPKPWKIRRSSVPTPSGWVVGGLRGITGEAMEKERARQAKLGTPGFEAHPDFVAKAVVTDDDDATNKGIAP